MIKTEIAIIGGGIIGTSIAYYLSKRGKKVVLVEKNDLASGASGACDQGIILQSKNPGIHLKLALKSAEIYKTLQQELDHPIQYRETGGMILIETEQEMDVMKDFVKKQREIGLEVHLLDKKEAAKLQKGLCEHLAGSTYSPQDAHVNSIEVTLAYAKAAVKNGATVLLHTEVIDVMKKGSRVIGLKTNKEEIYCDLVINSTGAWAPLIGKMVGLDIPIKPRRGQIVVTESAPPFVMGDILSARYIVAKYNPDLLKDSDDMGVKMGVGLSLSQTEKGNIFIGSTREFEGYDTSVTREGLKEILKYATRLVPGLKSLNMIRMFGGLRPYTPDGLPIIGYVDDFEGFFMAAGHEGDGIALSPVTGTMVSDIIINGKTFMDITPLNLKRFAN